MSVCEKCSEICDFMIDSIMCHGNCHKTFHVKCIGAPSSSIKLFNKSKPFYFFCVNCDPFAQSNIIRDILSNSKMIDRLQNQLLYLNDKIENISNIPILKRQHTRSASKSQNAPVENKSNKRKSEDLDLTLPIPSKKQSTNSPLESSPSSDSSNQCSATPPTLHVNTSQPPAPPIPPELNQHSSEQSAASTSNLAQLSVSMIQPASTLPPFEQPPASTTNCAQHSSEQSAITLLPSDQSTNSKSNPVQLPVSSTKPASTSPTASSRISPAN